MDDIEIISSTSSVVGMFNFTEHRGNLMGNKLFLKLEREHSYALFIQVFNFKDTQFKK